jgi:hypothetical protein
MFVTLLEPGNAPLYHRIVGAVSAVLAPALARIIAEGGASGVFDAGDPALAAEVLLGLSDGRRACVIEALEVAQRDVDAGMAMIVRRVRSEEALADRVLRAGQVELLGPEAAIREMLVDWNAAGGAAEGQASA